MDDDLHDLTPAQRLPDDSTAVALRRALDAPAPDHDTLLAGVQARATRRHRRGLVATTSGVAVAVAAAALVPALVGAQGTAAPTRARTTAPPAAPAVPVEPAAGDPLLRAGDVTAFGPLRLTASSQEHAVPGRAVVGGACTDAVLPVPEPAASWRVDLTGTAADAPSAAAPRVGLVETVWRFDDPVAAGAVLDAVRAQVPACAGPGPGGLGPVVEQDAAYVWPVGGRVLALTRQAGGPTQEVQVVVVSGSTVVRLEAAGLTAADGGAAVDALARTARVATKRAIASATVPAPAPHQVTHGPDPRE